MIASGNHVVRLAFIHLFNEIVRVQISSNFPPFVAATFSKAPANAARFSAFFGIMRCILAHIGTTSPRLEETPQITPVDFKSGIEAFRYFWRVQKVVVKKSVPLAPVTKCPPFYGRQSSPKTSMQWAEKSHDDAMQQIRRYCTHKIQSASIWSRLFMYVFLFLSRYIAFCGQTCLAACHVLLIPTLLQRRTEVCSSFEWKCMSCSSQIKENKQLFETLQQPYRTLNMDLLLFQVGARFPRTFHHFGQCPSGSKRSAQKKEQT